MKRKHTASLIVGVWATAFQVAIPIAGCESMGFDPQAFLGDNTCRFFNCDTLFFLQTDHADDEHDEMTEMTDEHDEMDTAESEDHTHG